MGTMDVSGGGGGGERGGWGGGKNSSGASDVWRAAATERRALSRWSLCFATAHQCTGRACDEPRATELSVAHSAHTPPATELSVAHYAHPTPPPHPTDVFWDHDTFTQPALLLLHPALAESTVQYRLHRLAGARAKAKSYPNGGYQGALVPGGA